MMYHKVLIVTTLFTVIIKISSFWGSLLLGSHYFRGTKKKHETKLAPALFSKMKNYMIRTELKVQHTE